MLRCTRILEGTARPTHELHLGFEERARSRLAGVCRDGTAVAVLLPRGASLRDGTLLAGEDGSVVRVIAAAQPVARVTAASPLALLRAVYHLANRHVPAQLAADHVLIERDPVLERMLQALGARVEPIEAPFDPEPGAYGSHGHEHAHGDACEADAQSVSLGEQLSIEAHRLRSPSGAGGGNRRDGTDTA